jgi:hypothetical protein
MPGGAKAKHVPLTLASDRAELMDGLFDAQVVAVRGNVTASNTRTTTATARST